MSKPDSLDPLNVNGRLYQQIARMLEEMENGSDTTLRERILSELNAKRQTDATLRDRIVEALEEQAGISTSERIRAFMAIGRVLTVFAALRKENHEPGDRGSAVRKYAAAFTKPDAARGRARDARSRSARSTALAAALADAADDDEDDSAA